jgi:hypothetical protein
LIFARDQGREGFEAFCRQGQIFFPLFETSKPICDAQVLKATAVPVSKPRLTSLSPNKILVVFYVVLPFCIAAVNRAAMLLM